MNDAIGKIRVLSKKHQLSKRTVEQWNGLSG